MVRYKSQDLIVKSFCILQISKKDDSQPTYKKVRNSKSDNITGDEMALGSSSKFIHRLYLFHIFYYAMIQSISDESCQRDLNRIIFLSNKS